MEVSPKEEEKEFNRRRGFVIISGVHKTNPDEKKSIDKDKKWKRIIQAHLKYIFILQEVKKKRPPRHDEKPLSEVFACT